MVTKILEEKPETVAVQNYILKLSSHLKDLGKVWCTLPEGSKRRCMKSLKQIYSSTKTVLVSQFLFEDLLYDPDSA